jgi:hypothetical protein
VLGLGWRDVDLDQRVLAVRRTLQYRLGEGFHLVPPKTARSRRIVPLPYAVVDALKLRREQQETDRLTAGVEFWDDWAWSSQRASARPCLRAMTIGTSNGWSAPPGCAMFGCMTCGTPLRH